MATGHDMSGVPIMHTRPCSPLLAPTLNTRRFLMKKFSTFFWHKTSTSGRCRLSANRHRLHSNCRGLPSYRHGLLQIPLVAPLTPLDTLLPLSPFKCHPIVYLNMSWLLDSPSLVFLSFNLQPSCCNIPPPTTTLHMHPFVWAVDEWVCDPYPVDSSGHAAQLHH